MVSVPFTTILKDRVQQHTTHEGQRKKLGCFEFVFSLISMRAISKHNKNLQTHGLS